MALGVGLLLSCSRAPEPTFPLRTAAGGRPNVLLITIDTLRADHLGTYGYSRPTSPTIDALAARGVRCERAIAAAPETAPGTAALLTGLAPHRNHVVANGDRLPPSVVTLAELMTSAGYATAAVVGNGLVGASQGFDQGFGHFEGFYGPVTDGSTQRDGTGVDRALAWLEGHSAAPWFLWLHLFDPHGPYRPNDTTWAEPFAAAYAELGPRQRVRVGAKNVGLGVIPRYQALPGLFQLGEYVRRYDSEIRETDAALGRLFAGTERRGQTADTLVVLSADHGESLTEHREFLQHGWFLYDTTLHIPLLFAWPHVVPEGGTIPEQVRGIDLVPTLAEIVGIPRDAAAPALDGVSFAPRLLGRGTPSALPAFAVGPHENHPLAIREDGWMLVQTLAGARPLPIGPNAMPQLQLPRVELYDTRADPAETNDLSARETGRVAALTAKLDDFRREYERATAAFATERQGVEGAADGMPAPPDKELQDRLRELGYLD